MRAQEFSDLRELVEDAAKSPIPDFTVPLKNSDTFTIVGHDTRRFEARIRPPAQRSSARFAHARHNLPSSGWLPRFGKTETFDAAKAKTVAGAGRHLHRPRGPRIHGRWCRAR
jgi:hypothetical protein